MLEISEFVSSKNIIDKNAEMTAILFQVFYMQEEYENCDSEILTLNHELE